jgi:hypothetical protein
VFFQLLAYVLCGYVVLTHELVDVVSGYRDSMFRIGVFNTPDVLEEVRLLARVYDPHQHVRVVLWVTREPVHILIVVVHEQKGVILLRVSQSSV